MTSVLYEGELQNYTLNKNARREIVAELLFRGSRIPQVTWTALTGYDEYSNANQNVSNDGNGNVSISKRANRSLSSEVFGLYPYGWDEDGWGRPQFKWKATLNPSKDRTVATLAATPVVTADEFHTTKRECDVAEMMNFDDENLYVLYVDGSKVTNAYKVVAKDVVTKVGGEGRKVEIYTKEAMMEQFPWHNVNSYWNTVDGDDDARALTYPEDTIVMVDTYLAKVISKTDAVLDPAGHVITPARLVVDLFDGSSDNANGAVRNRPPAASSRTAAPRTGTTTRLAT